MFIRWLASAGMQDVDMHRKKKLQKTSVDGDVIMMMQKNFKSRAPRKNLSRIIF